MEAKIEKEFKLLIKSVDREYLLERCKQYRVRHSTIDTLPTLCYKYLKKRARVQDWKEDPNEFLNPDIMLKDEVIKLIVADYFDPLESSVIKENINKLLSQFIFYEELITLAEKVKKRRE